MLLSKKHSELAPIILFTYSRANELRKTLEALKKNLLANKSLLYIISDGPKKDASDSDIEKIKKVRELIRSEKWCREVIIIERESNRGLAKNIISGVTEIITKYGKAIVLEDDLETSPYFLKYMNDSLNFYKNNHSVLSIGASNFFHIPRLDEETFYYSVPDCYGWATWEDRWSLLMQDGAQILNEIKRTNSQHQFDLYGNYPFIKLLKSTINNKSSSWAVLWYATSFLNNKLNVYPIYSLTNHIGQGSEATHASDVDFSKEITMAQNPIRVMDITTDKDYYTLVNKAYYRQYYNGFKGQLKYLYHKVFSILH